MNVKDILFVGNYNSDLMHKVYENIDISGDSYTMCPVCGGKTIVGDNFCLCTKCNKIFGAITLYKEAKGIKDIADAAVAVGAMVGEQVAKDGNRHATAQYPVTQHATVFKEAGESYVKVNTLHKDGSTSYEVYELASHNGKFKLVKPALNVVIPLLPPKFAENEPTERVVLTDTVEMANWLNHNKIPATTFADGWRDMYAAPLLKMTQKHVILMFTPASESSFYEIGQTLTSFGLEIKMAPLAETFSDDVDFGHLLDDYNSDDLRKLLSAAIDNAKDFETAETPVIKKKPYSILDSETHYVLSSLTLADVKSIPYVVAGLIYPGINFLAGPPKCHKSFFALNGCICIANGDPFLGLDTAKCEIIYMDLENSKEQDALRLKNRIIDGDLPSGVHVVHDCNAPDGMPYTLADTDGDHSFAKVLRQTVAENPKIRLIVIDTYECIKGDFRKVPGSTSYEKDCYVLHNLSKVAKELGIAILFLHHFRKNVKSQSSRADKVSGSTGMTGCAESIIMVYNDLDNDSLIHMETVSRNAEETIMDLTFDPDTLSMVLVDSDVDEAQRNKARDFFIDHAPDNNGGTRFISYSEAADALLDDGYLPETAAQRIRDIIEACKDMMLTRGIAIAPGTRTNDARGFTIFKIGSRMYDDDISHFVPQKVNIDDTAPDDVEG